MLLEQLGESGNGYIEGIGAIILLEPRELRLAGDTLGFLELLELGFGIIIDLVAEGRKRSFDRIVEEPTLLEEERDVGLVADLEQKDRMVSQTVHVQEVFSSERTLS